MKKTFMHITQMSFLGTAIILLLFTSVWAVDGDSLTVGDGFGLPGSSGNAVNLILENLTAVKGMYLIIKDNPDYVTLAGAAITARSSNHAVHVVDEGDTSKILLIPDVIPAVVIASDSGDVLSLSYNVKAGAQRGTFVTLTIEGQQIANASNAAIETAVTRGIFWIGEKCDVDANGMIDIFDVLRMIDIALMRPPLPTPYESWAGDFDNDGSVTVLDINEAIDRALAISLVLAGSPTKSDYETKGSVNLDLCEPVETDDGYYKLPISIRTTHSIAGLQISLKCDANQLNIGQAEMVDIASHMQVSTLVTKDEIRFLIWSSKGQSIPPGEGVLLNLPVRQSNEQIQTPVLTLNAAKAAGDGGYKLEALLNEKEQDQVVPETFALFPNSPNPFNPITNITYEIPQLRSGATSVRLNIYNIHGQLVRTLVDSRHSSGRYTVVWDGRDNYGRPVSSGVYHYQLQAGQTILHRKMVLLK